MTVGAGDNDLSDYGQRCFQITPKLVAAGNVVEIYKRLFAEKNLLHVGKIGELCNAMLHVAELRVKLCFYTFGKSLERAFKLIPGKGVNEQRI